MFILKFIGENIPDKKRERERGRDTEKEIV